MALQRIFSAPRSVLEVSERKPLLSPRALSRRGVETPVPKSIKHIPLMSWTHIINLVIGRPMGSGKVTIVLGLLMCFASQTEGDSCPCITQTRQGTKIVHTLVYKSVYKCTDTVTKCVFDEVTYQVCTKSGQTPICYDPQKEPVRVWIELREGKQGYGKIYARKLRSKLNSPVSLAFYTKGCANGNQNHRYSI